MDMTLLAQTVSLALPAAWLTLGVRDNILHPSVNETLTAQVFTFARMKDAYPEIYARFMHRSIHNRRSQRAAFVLVILVELLTVLILWLGVGLLASALLGLVAIELAQPIALLGALMFTALWGMFTVVGNHFSYWCCHEGAQSIHFQLMLWGMANLIFLSL